MRLMSSWARTGSIVVGGRSGGGRVGGMGGVILEDWIFYWIDGEGRGLGFA